MNSEKLTRSELLARIEELETENEDLQSRLDEISDIISDDNEDEEPSENAEASQDAEIAQHEKYNRIARALMGLCHLTSEVLPITLEDLDWFRAEVKRRYEIMVKSRRPS